MSLSFNHLLYFFLNIFYLSSYLSTIMSTSNLWSIEIMKLICKFKTRYWIIDFHKEKKLKDLKQNSPLCSNLQQVGREGKKEHREKSFIFFIFLSFSFIRKHPKWFCIHLSSWPFFKKRHCVSWKNWFSKTVCWRKLLLLWKFSSQMF